MSKRNAIAKVCQVRLSCRLLGEGALMGIEAIKYMALYQVKPFSKAAGELWAAIFNLLKTINYLKRWSTWGII